MFVKLWQQNLFLLGVWQTIYLTVISTVFAYVLGLPLGLPEFRALVFLIDNAA